MLEIFCSYCFIGFVLLFIDAGIRHDLRFFPYDNWIDRVVHVIIMSIFIMIYIMFWPLLLVLKNIS